MAQCVNHKKACKSFIFVPAMFFDNPKHDPVLFRPSRPIALEAFKKKTVFKILCSKILNTRF